MSHRIRPLLAFVLVAGLALPAVSPAQQVAAAGAYTKLSVTPAAKGAAIRAQTVHRKMFAVSPAVNAAAGREGLSAAQAEAATRGVQPQRTTSGPRFPGDLFYFGGATLASTQHHAIYLQPNGQGCKVSNCWGNPEGFLRDLGRSRFVHVIDQYVGSTSNGRYGVGKGYTIAYPQDANPYTDADMITAVVAAAQQSGQVGYGHMYHVFLPPGVDECFDASYSTCYSPDNPSTWYFCAYHGSVDIQGLGHVVYSVEPYQNVGGCSVLPGSPNGSLADSTNSVLSHEVFEAITDPDGDGWWNLLNNGLFGQEIGDECSFLGIGADGFLAFDPSLWTAGEERRYATQPEYNNNTHSCTVTP